ncbi:hypothetical protein QVD17_04608 [Tagetes erecta]|uniref:CCT domain-containing protein n=1 Tax=Tagetes erecta TaxID=13708 RepID=A0AAD8PAV9_TARER|nr:hypothetical protein QVD17_04608 [Tagetes erecta]
MITKKPPSRKTRTKLRKPKYLSLRLQLTATVPPPPPAMPSVSDHKQLINLFPLHPENLVEQYKIDDEHNMACIFSSPDDVDKAATTLTGILCSDAADDDDDTNTNINNLSPSPSPSSVNYADEEVELVRTAMRGNKRERSDDDEKWICYSEVVERKEIGGGSSSSSCCYGDDVDRKRKRSKLVLKLDYEMIMKTWVNKGPLYIHSGLDAPLPQTVPDAQDDHDLFLPSSINGTRYEEQDYGGNGGSWTVPELTHIENNGISRGDEAMQAGESNVMIHNREASVQRYKEKRRNRLFAKTIRYEVRKLNAEKRPRIKGRFVKRN